MQIKTYKTIQVEKDPNPAAHYCKLFLEAFLEVVKENGSTKSPALELVTDAVKPRIICQTAYANSEYSRGLWIALSIVDRLRSAYVSTDINRNRWLEINLCRAHTWRDVYEEFINF